MKPDLRDAVFALGLVLTSTGLYLVYPPAALIFPGLVLLYVSLKGGRR